MTVADKLKIEEARSHAFREGSSQTGQRREIVIIEAGWGSSGYYGEKVLERDIPRIFPAGTHMYLDHPTESEDRERPERSVKDLIGVTLETPRMAGIQSVTVAEIFEHWVPVIEAMAKHIGLSIRAFGISEWGSSGGKDGNIIEALTEGLSIDYVTLPGAGGEVGKVLESFRESMIPLIEGAREKSKPHLTKEARNAGNHLEARIHKDFTNHADYLYGEGHLTRDERITLSKGIGSALDSFAETVQNDAPQLYQRDPYSELDEAESRYIENKANGRSGDLNQEDADMAESEGLSELKAEFRSLKESMESQVKEANDRADKAENSLKEAEKEKERREEAAKEGNLRTEAIKEADGVLGKYENVPEAAKERVIESVVSGTLPTTGDGALDKGVIQERTRARLREEAQYLGSASKLGEVDDAAGGGGGEFDFRESDREPVSESNGKTGDKIEEGMKRFGLSEAAAKVAAKGR